MRTCVNYRLPYLTVKDHLATLNYPDLCLQTVGEDVSLFFEYKNQFIKSLHTGWCVGN